MIILLSRVRVTLVVRGCSASTPPFEYCTIFWTSRVVAGIFPFLHPVPGTHAFNFISRRVHSAFPLFGFILARRFSSNIANSPSRAFRSSTFTREKTSLRARRCTDWMTLKPAILTLVGTVFASYHPHRGHRYTCTSIQQIRVSTCEMYVWVQVVHGQNAGRCVIRQNQRGQTEDGLLVHTEDQLCRLPSAE